jgi:uncharacterized membrane-anchored protein
LFRKSEYLPSLSPLLLFTMSKPLAGVIAIVVNAVVTGLVLAIIKKDVTEKDMDTSQRFTHCWNH